MFSQHIRPTIGPFSDTYREEMMFLDFWPSHGEAMLSDKTYDCSCAHRRYLLYIKCCQNLFSTINQTNLVRVWGLAAISQSSALLRFCFSVTGIGDANRKRSKTLFFPAIALQGACQRQHMFLHSILKQ